MQPGTFAFQIRRGDTERLAVVLKRQEVFTGQVGLVPMADKVAHWSVDLPAPDGRIERTTLPNGGLGYDPDTGEVSWDLDPALSGKFVGPVPYRLWLSDSDGGIRTWLVGTITGEG